MQCIKIGSFSFFFSLTYTLFYKNYFIRIKAWILAKKTKNKVRTKPGLLSHRTQEQGV